MKKSLLVITLLSIISTAGVAQVEPGAGKWKTWFITSVKDYRVSPPPANKTEVAELLRVQENIDARTLEQIQYWNAGAPGHRWYPMVMKLWMSGAAKGSLANMLMGTATYDAMIAAWDSKYTYNRPRPYATDKRIKLLVPKIESPSYPCEHAVAAGVAVTIISHFYPNMSDSVKRMADKMMTSRVAAGAAFPADTRAGFELGRKIAEAEIAKTKDYLSTKQWDASMMPKREGIWNGKTPMMPFAGLSKTVALDSASEFRPGPPPDFAKEMEELRQFKQTFRSRANAFYYASQPIGDDLMTRKILEYNLDLNPPRSARFYAAVSVAYYDVVAACFEAKYFYWGIRPDQYDPTYQPLVPTPPFPGYPSGHAAMCGVIEGLFPYFFPLEKPLFQSIAKEGAESRFQAGIHFRTDNEAGLALGRNVAGKVLERITADGADSGPKDSATVAKRTY